MELPLISGPVVLANYKFLGPLDTAKFKSLGILCRTIVNIVACYSELFSISDTSRTTFKY